MLYEDEKATNYICAIGENINIIFEYWDKNDNNLCTLPHSTSEEKMCDNFEHILCDFGIKCEHVLWDNAWTHAMLHCMWRWLYEKTFKKYKKKTIKFFFVVLRFYFHKPLNFH